MQRFTFRSGFWFGCILLGIALVGASESAAAEGPASTLLNGVKEIAAPGLPGSLAVLGPHATPVVGGGATVEEPVVACAAWNSGRVVAYGHDGYLDPVTFTTADTKKLFLNAVAWTADAKKKPRVGILDNTPLLKRLQQEGIAAFALQGPTWWQSLIRVDVLVIHTPSLQDAEVREAVKRFVTGGGGLIIGDCGWGWQQLNPGKTLTKDHPGNQLLYPAGILWTNGSCARTSPKGFRVAAPPSPNLNATRALESILMQNSGRLRLTDDDLTQCTHTLVQALTVLPENDTFVFSELHWIRKRVGRTAVPTPKNPIAAKNALLRTMVAMDVFEMKHLPAKAVKPHPAAPIFPGFVPRYARSVDRKLTIDTRVPGWHSTGLYARPGGLMVVTLPGTAAKQGLQLRIGAHSDTIWNHKEWKRMPELCRTWPLTATTTDVAHGMGGLVYVVVPDGCRLGKVEVRIDGAVEAPLFVLGETRREDWIGRRSKLPAPWAELATKKIILTVPSFVVRELRDPDELLKTWDRVLDADADLARIPADRPRPERFVLDEQISVGYMHSGYPLMAHLDVARTMVNSRMVAAGEGTWGFFHEIGHNHQSPDWTFDGTTEVTVNLFTLYVHEKVCKRADMGTRQVGGNLIDEAERNQRIRPYFMKGARFADWKADPIMALCMYIQLQQAFGWKAFQEVFEEYRGLPAAQRPKTDAAKRDQWMVRFSRRVGKNLGAFFEAWGVPTSAAARQQVAHLPRWLPPNFPPR